MLKRIVYAVGSLLLALALFCLWYSIAANYDYDELAGTYTFSGDGVSSTLVLKADATYQQELRHNGRVDYAKGTWHRSGMAGVGFSNGFLRLPGTRTAIEEWPDSSPSDPDAHTFYGHFRKVLGIYPVLDLNPNPPVLTFKKCLLNCPNI